MDLQEFFWDPARLSAWLSEGGTESASSSVGCRAAGSVQPVPCQGQPQFGSNSDQQVPQHLRQLLLALLKAAADDGHGQELIWTPARLAQWLADSRDAPSTTCSGDSTESGPSSADGSPSVDPSPRSYVQLLPLVRNVTASKAQAQQVTKSSSTSSDGSGTSCVTYPDLGAPCSSIMQLQAAGSDERTSPPSWQVQHSSVHGQPELPSHAAHTASPCMGKQPPQHMQDATAAAQQHHAQLLHQAPPAVPQLHNSHLWGVAKEAKPGDYAVVEHNAAWHAGAFKASAAAAASSLGLPALGGTNPPSRPGGADNHTSSVQVATDSAAQQQPKPGQAPRFGVLMLAHEKGVTAAEVWEAWEAQHGGRAVVRVHLKQGVSTAGLPGDAFISSRLLPSRIHTKWGCISLTSAILQAAADMLQQHPQLQHIAVASGQDVPVAGLPRDLRPGLSLFGRFQFGQEFDEAARQVACDVLQAQLEMSQPEARAWADALVFHHTWMVLDRQLLLALISKQDEVRRVGAVLNERFMQPDVAVAADEFILVTAAMRYGFVKQVIQKKLQAHISAVRRQHKQHTAALPARRVAEQASSDVGEQPAKQRRAGSEGPDSSGSVVHMQAAATGADGDSSGQDSAGADARSSADRASANDSSSRPGTASRGSSRSTTEATWAPVPEDSLLRVHAAHTAMHPVAAPPVSCHVQQPGLTTQQQQQQGCQQVQNGPAAAGLSRSTGLQGSGTAGDSPQPISRPSSGRRPRRADAASGAADVRPEELVGQRIRVWWQLDEAYYCGTVTYYSLSTKRHTVKYDDGDVEIINLAKESWKLEEPAGNAYGTQGGKAAAAEAAAGGGASTQQETGSSGSTASPMHEGTYGVLLDCCPTLALFHPTDTRHPHEWRNFSECRLCDVNSERQGNHKLTLLEALGMSQPNAALFFRKVVQMQRQGPGQLLGCLKLLWKGKTLPDSIDELQLD